MNCFKCLMRVFGRTTASLIYRWLSILYDKGAQLDEVLTQAIISMAHQIGATMAKSANTLLGLKSLKSDPLLTLLQSGGATHAGFLTQMAEISR